MHRNYFFGIVILALFCLLLVFFSLLREIESPIVKEPSIVPPAAPYKNYISGVGIVEASSGNISISSPLNRVVDKVLVVVGQKIKKGDKLILLESRDLQAELLAEQGAYRTSLAKLQRLEAFPRPEDIATATAALNKSKAEMDLAKNQYEMVQNLPDPRAISQEEKNRRLFNEQQAIANWEQVQADLEKVKGGTWKPDLEIARIEVLQARDNLNRIKTELDRTIITSPIDGTVLQINIHDGEFASPDTDKTLLILGNIDKLNLRVSINQLDIPLFHSNSPAVAYLQDNAKEKFPLEFIRIEPFVTNKKNLTHELTEKTDTKVLQIIYQIITENRPLFVGQQMDVFIEAKNSP